MKTPNRIATAIAAAAFVLVPASGAHAGASSASSASSQAGSASVGSLSTSFETSSASSTGDTKTAAGDYRLVEIAAAPGRAGFARMTLQALADARAEFFLVLPQQAADDSRLAAGGVVTIRERGYGLEFAAQATQQAFFLALNEPAMRELQTRAVRL